MRKDNPHTLLVAPYEQSRETHFALSRMIWKAVEGLLSITKRIVCTKRNRSSTDSWQTIRNIS